jgi:hypothetical protein
MSSIFRNVPLHDPSEGNELRFEVFVLTLENRGKAVDSRLSTILGQHGDRPEIHADEFERVVHHDQ